MRKVSKLLQCLFLGGFICMMSPQQASGFLGLTPPLPFDIEVDIPDDAAKVISILKAAYRKLQTIKTAANSLNLESIKGGALGELAGGSLSKYKEGPKSPVKDELEEVSALGLDKGDVRETQYFNAFKTLFFTAHDSSGQDRINYREKTIEFKQDMIIDTYVAGRLTEDYLILVEKTVKRLDECQQGAREDCTFFGLEWSKIESTDEAPENEDNPGQMGEARNSYIVVTIYDRLMRLVEDMAATEAMFRSSQYIDYGKPVHSGDSSSDASQYINKKFHFAHHQTHETSYAVGTNARAPMKNMQIAKILNKLQQIDVWQQSALAMHNLKVKLPEYKAMYRKYLKAKQVHERALQALKDSDGCAKTFINTYKHKLTESWGESNPINDYANRSGISRELINAYEKAVQTTIIEEDNNLCPGYYYKGECPAGYKEGKACEVVTMEEYTDPATGNINVREHIETIDNYHECVMDMAQQDAADTNEEVEAEDLDKLAQDDTDYLEDDDKIEDVKKDTRIKGEKVWRIAEKKLMQLTKSEQLKFEPWNDQKNLQAEYLRQKYNNMKLIVLSLDDAVNTFKIAAQFVKDHKDKVEAKLAENKDYKKAKLYVRAVTGCKAAEKVTTGDDPISGWCAEADCGCSIISADNASGKIVAQRTKKKEYVKYDDEGNEVSRETRCDDKQTKSWTQLIEIDEEGDSYSCLFPQDPKAIEPLATEGNCPDKWNLSAEFLVENYFMGVDKLGNCAATIKEGADNMRKTAKAEPYERRVAQDMVREIIDLRLKQQKEMQLFVKDYEKKLRGRKDLYRSLKKRLGETNEKIGVATKIKNEASKEKTRAELRVEAISKELVDLDQQLEINKGQTTIDVTNGDVIPDDKQHCALDLKIYKLKFEASAICKGADTGKHAQCANFVADLEPWGEGTESCQAVRKREKNYDEDIKQASELKEEAFIIETDFTDELSSTKHVKLVNSDKKIDEQNKILEDLKAERDSIKAQLKSLEEEMKAAAKAFADAYVKLAIEHQKKLEGENTKFEEYLKESYGPRHNRMQQGSETQCKIEPFPFGGLSCEKVAKASFKLDNLESTLKNILYNKSQLAGKDEIIWTGLDEKWKVNDLSVVKAALVALDVPDAFNDNKDIKTIDNLALKVRDLTVNAATEVLAFYIQDIDKRVEVERKKAEKLINERAEDIGVSEGQTPNELQLAIIAEHGNYADNGIMITEHEKLLKELRKPSEDGVAPYDIDDLSDFFGIPKDGELYTTPPCEESFRDDKFFVGLPARGNNYVDADLSEDPNAGRDFRAPRVPLLNLAPLREVFFFSTYDYEDMPREDDGTPSWTTFLNLKYVPSGWNDYAPTPDLELDADVKTWEYMPETWLYILARPNMRNDGKYQQTFEERSYGDGKIGQLLANPNDEDYGVHIARAGVYPCRLGSKIIDIEPGRTRIGPFSIDLGRVEDIAFISGGSIVPDTPECKEIAYNLDEKTTCGIRNKGKKGGICHLLADHGVKDIEDSQTGLGGGLSNPYPKQSELGNLFEFSDNRIKYRKMQESIHNYLLDEDHTDNDINHQKAERASYTRNIFSSFLDAVSAEHNAKKNLENTKKSLEDAMLNLCHQIHAQGYAVSEDDKVEEGEECGDECDQKCVTHIMDGAGLATSADKDTKYGAASEYNSSEYDFGDINCAQGSGDGSFYGELFCLLDTLKNELVEKSRKGDKPQIIHNERIIDNGTETDIPVGWQNLGSAAGEAERDSVFEVSMDEDKVAERMQIIKNMDAALDEDKEETVFLSPSLGTLDNEAAVRSKVGDEKKEAVANRTAEREGDEEAIKSMDNQAQVVPYCPLYMNNRQPGL